MKEASIDSRLWLNTLTAHTLAKLYRQFNKKEDVNDMEIERYAKPIVENNEEIPEEDRPWLIEHIKFQAWCFLEQTEWSEYKCLCSDPRAIKVLGDVGSVITVRMKHIC